jgi:hypothetical protein
MRALCVAAHFRGDSIGDCLRPPFENVTPVPAVCARSYLSHELQHDLKLADMPDATGSGRGDMALVRWVQQKGGEIDGIRPGSVQGGGWGIYAERDLKVIWLLVDGVPVCELPCLSDMYRQETRSLRSRRLLC